MNAAAQEARQAKCARLMLLSSAWRTAAHQFFSHLDFDGEKKRGIVKYLNRRQEAPTSG